MDGIVRTEFEIISIEEIRKVLTHAGLPVTETEAAAIADLVREAGSVHNARLSLETIDAQRDAA